MHVAGERTDKLSNGPQGSWIEQPLHNAIPLLLKVMECVQVELRCTVVVCHILAVNR